MVSSSVLLADIPLSINGDYLSDLVIGVADEDIGSIQDAGMVNIIYATPNGLSSDNDQGISQNESGVSGDSNTTDWFGDSVALGDFNHDGYVDMAVGIIGENVDGVSGAGAVHIFYATQSGIDTFGDKIWTQNSSQQQPDGSIVMIDGEAEQNDFFGDVVITGDFNGDGYDDLAVGVQHEDIGSEQDAGAVNVLYGSSNGITAKNNQIWSQTKSSDDIEGGSEQSDHFGYSLCSGDFNGDGYDDLAVGVPDEQTAGYNSGGAVNVIYGSSSGLSATGNIYIHLGSLGLSGGESNDQFGFSLTSGNFNGDSYMDLAVGSIRRDVSGVNSAGMVSIIYGDKNGLDQMHNTMLYHNSTASSPTEAFDQFGWILSSGDFDGDKYDDLVVGIPFKDSGTISNSGAIEIFYGDHSGINTSSSFFEQRTSDIGLSPDANDHFAQTLASGYFNNDKYMDIAIGIPNKAYDGHTEAGAVHILYGSTSGISVTNYQFWTQNTAGIEGMVEDNDRFGSALAATPPRDIQKASNNSIIPIIFYLLN
jgi:hypothetical protein